VNWIPATTPPQHTNDSVLVWTPHGVWYEAFYAGGQFVHVSTGVVVSNVTHWLVIDGPVDSRTVSAAPPRA
jgi:hypothetical protein